MKTAITLTLRQFPVRVHDHRIGEEADITVTLDKSQLRAAQLVGQSSKELIKRLCERKGYTVLQIGTPERRVVELDLDELFSTWEE